MNSFLVQNFRASIDKPALIAKLETWSSINTHCDHLPGLETMLSLLKEEFKSLNGNIEEIALSPRTTIDHLGNQTQVPVGKALRITKRPDLTKQLLLAGHYDTVFETSSPFQKASLHAGRLQGPGVADMKGGLLIMLESLRLFEKTSEATSIGWQVLITPDEEIGSPSSDFLYLQPTRPFQAGLVFEPSFPDGSLVSARKGSYSFTVIARGRQAHVGRDFPSGRSAIAALAHFIVSAHALNQQFPNAIINIGKIHGGEASNIVPEFAMCKINLRGNDEIAMNEIESHLLKVAKSASLAIAEEGILIDVIPTTRRPPKPFDTSTEKLFQGLKLCGKEMGIPIDWRSTGGCSDGNLLAAAGIPTIDTLGAIGGNLHTTKEYIEIDSLIERILLTAAFLMSFAAGEISVN